MSGDSNHKAKWMQLPRYVVVGHDVLSEVANVCKDLKLYGDTLIVTGSNTLRVAGKHVMEILEDADYKVETIITEEASMEEVAKVEKKAQDIGADIIIGVGGGRNIDIAKLVSTRLDVPFFSIPTAASHDGIASNRASILHDGESVSVMAQAPLAVIADTGIIAQAPYRLLVAGYGDIVSNYTAVLDWQLAQRLRGEPYSEYAAALSQMTAEILVDSADLIKEGLEESAWIVVKALVSSGVAMSIAGSSRPASGSEHKFSHALDRVAPGRAYHGEQAGVGAIMMMYLHGGDWENIRDSLKRVGAPTNADELGMSDKEIIDALLIAHTIREERYTILGNGLTPVAARNLAIETKVI